MAILLVEQFYDFAAELADQYLVMERGEIVMRGRGADMATDGVRQRMSIRARTRGRHARFSSTLIRKFAVWSRSACIEARAPGASPRSMAASVSARIFPCSLTA